MDNAWPEPGLARPSHPAVRYLRAGTVLLSAVGCRKVPIGDSYGVAVPQPEEAEMRIVAALVIAGLAVSPSLVYGQSQTEKEVTQTILEANAYINTNLRSQADGYSSQGALEFWSSGGLLNEIPASGRPDEWNAINITPKYIKVIPLVEGQAAVALYYSEGMMQPKGSAAVSNYLTRVTQVFVKENGKWKVRASHWSAVTGGAGTSQTALEK
jgi:hypothetical protein